jgi:hypothetical protein
MTNLQTPATNDKLIKADPTKGVRVDAAIVAKRFRDEIKENVAQLKAKGIGEFLSPHKKS